MHWRRWWCWAVLLHVGLLVGVRTTVFVLPARRYVTTALPDLLVLIIQVGYWFWIIGSHVIRVIKALGLELSLRNDRRRLRVRETDMTVRSWVWRLMARSWCAVSRLARSCSITWRQLRKKVRWLALELVVVLMRLGVGIRIILLWCVLVKR